MASSPPNQAIGTYAPAKSNTVNQVGDGSIKTLLIPPSKKNKPITKASFNLLLKAIRPVINAPTKVPKACATNGTIKCLGSNKCMEDFRLSIFEGSTPSGGGMIELLNMIIPMFTILPRTIPEITAKIFFAIGFNYVFLLHKRLFTFT